MRGGKAEHGSCVVFPVPLDAVVSCKGTASVLLGCPVKLENGVIQRIGGIVAGYPSVERYALQAEAYS